MATTNRLIRPSPQLRSNLPELQWVCDDSGEDVRHGINTYARRQHPNRRPQLNTRSVKLLALSSFTSGRTGEAIGRTGQDYGVGAAKLEKP